MKCSKPVAFDWITGAFVFLLVLVLLWSICGCAATPIGSGKIGLDKSTSAGGDISGVSGAELAEILAVIMETVKWISAAIGGCVLYWLGVRPLAKSSRNRRDRRHDDPKRSTD